MYNNNASQYGHIEYNNTYQQYSQDYATKYPYQPYEDYSEQRPVQPPDASENFTNSNWTSYVPEPNTAVAQEMQQQKAELIKQREDYVQKALVLDQVLDQLQIQKQDLAGNGHSQDLDLTNILQQNSHLQEQIQGKIKAIHNVIEMLSGIIKDGKSISELKVCTKPAPSYPSEISYAHSRSPDSIQHNNDTEYCYVYYDTGLHWCRMCDEFPDTAKDLLLHLQDKKHMTMLKDNDVDSTPWHKLPPEPLMPSDESSPQKRVPIKGLQFFISAPSWYCKLCDVWIGDLHCASQHLKSKAHYQNYENFVRQNPQWEEEWIKDRETSLARRDSSDSKDDKKKRKHKNKQSSSEIFSMKDKKKKRKSKKSKKRKKASSESSSSSSSSGSSSDDTDKSKSIRVVMRNIQKGQSILDEDLSSKWSVFEKLVEEQKKKEFKEQEEERKQVNSTDDKLINQWMTISQPPAKEKMLLNSLKDRMRQKQELERSRKSEEDKMKREKEQQEIERMDRKKREEKEASEELERLRRKREQDELDRIRDKERNQVRFKPNSYRRKRSFSRSDDEDPEDPFYRSISERENQLKSRNWRSRSKSFEREDRISEGRHDDSDIKKKTPGPPSYKKLPFIGRMPLFKNKHKSLQDDKEEHKEIKKQSYEPPRKTRFEPGNLPRAFIPKPDVVCFPKLSSIPPLSIPPPQTQTRETSSISSSVPLQQKKESVSSASSSTTIPSPLPVFKKVPIPKPPKISNIINETQVNEGAPQAPPPPKIDITKNADENNLSDDEILYGSDGTIQNMIGNPYQITEYEQPAYSYQMSPSDSHSMPLQPPPSYSHSMPLQPPPLPPDDDLALLGICADDMAAQTF